MLITSVIFSNSPPKVKKRNIDSLENMADQEEDSAAEEGNYATKKIHFLFNWAQRWANRNPRSYGLIWVTLCNALIQISESIGYAWNIWVDRLFDMFYGDVPKTMGTGGPIYAFVLIIPFVGFTMLLTSSFAWFNKETLINLGIVKFHGGLKPLFWAGLLFFTVGLVCMGLALQFTQLWLLFIATILYGSAMGLWIPLFRTVPMMWFSAVGLRGFGAGVSNFWPGFWGAVFSYWGSALTDEWSMQAVVYIVLGLTYFGGFFMYPFVDVKVPVLEKYQPKPVEPKDDSAFIKGLVGETPKAKPVPLSALQILTAPTSWFTLATMFLRMAPAFGIKYLIAPMLRDVFDASQNTQNTASFLFLLVYSIARGGSGTLVQCFDALWLWRAFVLCSVPVFGIQGWLALQYADDAALYGFITCQCIIGAVLGAAKVLLFLVVMDSFGMVNFMSAIGMGVQGWGTAAAVGPVLGWLSLSNHGLYTPYDPDSPNDNAYKKSLSDAVSIFCWASAGVQFLSIIISFGIRPIDFSKYVPAATEKEAQDGIEAGGGGEEEHAEEKQGLLVDESAD